MSTYNFNETHPELREGEMFLTNAVKPLEGKYKTLRSGNQAYAPNSDKLHLDMYPVFVQKTEFDEFQKANAYTKVSIGDKEIAMLGKSEHAIDLCFDAVP